jgi:hypothetical protein
VEKKITGWILADLSLSETGIRNTVVILSDGDIVQFISIYN